MHQKRNLAKSCKIPLFQFLIRPIPIQNLVPYPSDIALDILPQNL